MTLLACALVGLPPLADPEDALEREEDFHRRCAEVIQRHGGLVIHWLGREVLACFGYPVAREDDSERAVRAGLEPREHSVVGIHTDTVVFTASPQPSALGGPALQGEELLGTLLDSVGEERLLVVLSARPGFTPPWPPRPGLHRLELGRLSARWPGAGSCPRSGWPSSWRGRRGCRSSSRS